METPDDLDRAVQSLEHYQPITPPVVRFTWAERLLLLLIFSAGLVAVIWLFSVGI